MSCYESTWLEDRPWVFFCGTISLNRLFDAWREFRVIRNDLLLRLDFMSSSESPILLEIPPKMRIFS